MSAKDSAKKYTEEEVKSCADEMIDRIASGECLIDICKEEHMPSPITWYSWFTRLPGLPERYAAARRAWSNFHAELCISIADDDSNDTMIGTNIKGDAVEMSNNAAVPRADLRIKTRIKLASIYCSSIHGDRKRIENLNIPKNATLATKLDEIVNHVIDGKVSPQEAATLITSINAAEESKLKNDLIRRVEELEKGSK